MKKIPLFWILIILLQVNPAVAQHSLPVFITDSLDNYVTRSMKVQQLPGLAVCIVRDGKVVCMKSYGVKEWGGNDPVDENTLFMIGSNTKAFTATAIATLSCERKLSLDDKVTKWLPSFKLDNQAAGEQAIIRDLLSHRIGFKTFQGDFMYWKSDLTRDQVIEKMGHIKAVYPFRTVWGYCNAGFLTAGEIIPRATGKSWEDYIREKIFIPLGMNRTIDLCRDLPAASNRSAAHDIVDGRVIKVPYCMIDDLAPAASISSSVSDISKWLIMLLNNGMAGNTRIIPEEAIREIWYPHSIIGSGTPQFNEGHFLLYGLGFELREYAGRKIVSHTGAVTGFLSSVTLVPEENLGIAVFTNSIRNSLFYSLNEEILDALLGLPYRNYSLIRSTSDQLDMAEQKVRENKYHDTIAMHIQLPLTLSEYTGTYTNDAYGNMQVVQEDGVLWMKFQHHPNLFARLAYLGNNRFYATFSDPEFETAVFPFSVDHGKVLSATVKVADFIEYTPYIFVKSAQ
jgi:CubicO group peptidase (beta-lactamase class C family)